MLNPGTRLGPYEIQASAGAGGMGEVYRARDTRLERSVAIKVLPSRLSDDPERRERMQREARAISSLQHPNICALYDVGSQDGTDYLVMEYLEGETLAQRLKRGALPLPQALKVGIEVAAALEKAHKSGIVHRDLKPGNIMLSKSGAKLMDFGLAKPAALAAAAGSGAGDTLTAALTNEGAIVGTIPYMAPEQFENKEADPRSDIFALGAVLYEMVTGRRAFTGKSQASVVAAILGRDPEPITSTQPLAPSTLDALIKTCLAKEPDERWQSAHDVAAQLALIGNASGAQAAATARDKLALVGWFALVVVGLGIMAGVLIWRLWPRTPAMPVARFSISVPAPARLDVDFSERAFTLSPDGQYIAYGALEGSVSHIFVRRMDQFEAVRVPDSEGGFDPVFSPDGRFVGFLNGSQFRIAPVAGGSTRVGADVQAFGGIAWGEDGSIVLSGPNLTRVPAAGGTVEPLTGASNASRFPGIGSAQYEPFILPGGKVVVFSRSRGSTTSVCALTLSSREVRTLIEGASGPIYSDGYLLYSSQHKLWAVRFDPVAVVISGKPAVLLDDVYGQVEFAAAGDLLAYLSAADMGRRNLVWTRAGENTEKLATPAADYYDIALSPDGVHAAASVRTESEQALQIFNVGSGTGIRVPTAPSPNLAPLWTNDGKYVIYTAPKGDQTGFYRSAADGSGQPELLATDPQMAYTTSVAPDGTIAVMRPAPKSYWEIAVLRPGASALSTFKTGAHQAVFSPDGRWIAYTGNATGRDEIYVEPYPGPGARYQISTEGGAQPQWSRDGRRLYFRSGSRMFAVNVDTRRGFSEGRPVLLFEKGFDRGGAVANYAVAPDGRLLMVQSAENNAREIRVLLNWTAALKH